MSRLRQRLKKLEAHTADADETVFICTGVPRHDKVGHLKVAITPYGWIAKKSQEADAQFKARVQGSKSCGR